MSPSPSPAAATGPRPGAREALADAALLAVDAVLTAGAALRVTRFATTDVLGGWALSDPLHRWADKREPGQTFGYAAPAQAWRHRLVSALDCPFCVGTQATIAIGAALALTSRRSGRRSRTSPLGRALRAACATLGAAYAVGHVSHRIDSAASAYPTTPATTPATTPVKDSK